MKGTRVLVAFVLLTVSGGSTLSIGDVTDAAAEPPSAVLFSPCELGGDIRLIDVTYADDALKAHYAEAVRQCAVDGLLFHLSKSGENACNDIVKCAEAVESSCGQAGSHAEIAMVANNQCRGSCGSGQTVTVNCA